NNNPFIIWSKLSSPKSIRAKNWNGTSFDSAVDVVGSDLMPTGFIGPEIASKGDTVYLIFESLLHNNHIIYLKKSFDGGLTFSDTIRVSENSNTHKFAMPNVAVREDGNPVISYMECLPNWTDWKQTVRTSFDFGTTFSAAADVSSLAPGEPCDCCQSTMVTNGNDDVFLLFRNNDTNVRNSYIAKSNDGGITFTSAQDLDDVNWVFNSCPTSSPVGAVNNDSIMVVRRNGGSGVNELYKSNVNINDLQKSYFTQLDASNAPLQDKAEIASFKNSPNWSVVVWEENRNGVKECFYSIIDDNGANLNAGVISDTSIFGHKIEPDISHVYDNNFAIVYTASTQYEVHFIFASVMDIILNTSEINSQNKQIVKSVDFLGKTITPEGNKPFLNMYNDGSVERKIIIE
ncbi:MAG: exo-alpha-sialidase, partial [Flavobacteriales bacterium]|nr:exo-alpha-sialidase [Flavobacteriales bacterium]